MQKNAIFVKAHEHMYRLNEANDASFFTLFMFLSDGLYKSIYVDFLNDRNQNVFNGNVSCVSKYNEMITITLHDYIIPEAIPFTSTVENLMNILKNWDDLRFQQFETITLQIQDNIVNMNGQ